MNYEPGLPPPPKWLGRLAKTEYRRVAALMQRASTCQKVDLAILAAYAHAYAEYWTLVQSIDGEGRTLTGPRGGLVVNPLCKERDSAFSRMKDAAAKLGFSPADRDRLKPRQQKKANPIDDLRG